METQTNEAHGWLRRARLAIVEAPFYVLNLAEQSFDAGEIVERVVACNANVIRLGAARTYAYFQSKIAPRAPSIGDRDFLAEVLAAAKPRGLKVVTYIQLGYEHFILYQQHPDWASRLADGRPMKVGRPEEVHFCCNTPYREWKISVIKEICSNYDIDGMYLDGPTYFGYCHCPVCRAKFAAQYRMDIPSKEDWKDPAWQEYALWRYQVLAGFLQDIREAVRQVRPEIPLLNNNITYFHGRCRRESRIPEILTRISDGILLESHRTHQRLAWHRVGQHAKYGYATGKPAWMWWEYNVGDWSFTACSDAELRLKYAEVLANGGTPGVFPFDVTGHAPQGLAALRDCFGFAAEHEERLYAARPVKFVALPYSRQTAEWYGAEAPDERYTATHTGLYRALSHRHVPFNLLLDPDLSEEGLRDYRVLVLSNVACLSDVQAQAVRAFVQNGGGLIATYETSLFDERGRRRHNFALADVFGADYVSTPPLEVTGQLAPGYPILEERQEWVMWQDVPIAGGKAGAVSYIQTSQSVGMPFDRGIEGALVPIGKHTYVTVCSGAESSGTILQPSLRSHPLGSQTSYPGAIAHTFGKGRVVYFPTDMGLDYEQMRVPFLTTVLDNALRWVAGEPWPLELDAPTSVEVQLHGGEQGLLAYLINFTGDSIDPRDEVLRIAPLRDVALRVHVPFQVERVTWLNHAVDLKFQMVDGYCAITLPQLDEFAVLGIDRAK